MSAKREEAMLFGFKPAQATPDNVAVMIFLMPEAAWRYMKAGLGHDFDMTKIGIPMKVLIGRTKNHKTGMEELRRAGLIDDNTKDLRDLDFSFDRDKPEQ